jgi:hypothetical protein
MCLISFRCVAAAVITPSDHGADGMGDIRNALLPESLTTFDPGFGLEVSQGMVPTWTFPN